MQVKVTNRTVLIVEDEISVALDLERILTDAGYHVVAIAADREGALAAAAGCGLAFVDVNLRDGPSGPGIARTMTERHGVRVVFVTANPAQIDGAPAVGFVRKPFSDRAIIAAAALAAGETPDPFPVEMVLSAVE